MSRRTLLVIPTWLLTGTAVVAQLPPPPAPPENPVTEAKRLLGKVLFWDEQLSSGGTVACATCHLPSAGGGDPRVALHPGSDATFGTPDDVRGSPGVPRTDATGRRLPDPLFGFGPRVTPRSANSAIGAAYAPELFHDGRAGGTFVDPETGGVRIPLGAALETQALVPILSDVEMAWESRTWDDVRSKLVRSVPLDGATDLPPDLRAALALRPGYPDLFAAAFGDPAITAERIGFAIATYERTLIADRTPWDAFIAGNPAALTPAQQQGWNLFQGVGCAICHTPPLFTNHSFRNLGIRPPGEDPGRQAVTGLFVDRGRFKVPTLRNAGLRPTFMHNGQLPAVPAAVGWYLPGNPNRFPDNLDPLLPLAFDPLEQQQIADFLTGGLTDSRVAAADFPFDHPALQRGNLAALTLPDPEALVWPPLPGVVSFRVYRGDLADLSDQDGDGAPDGGYGFCLSDLDPDPTDAVLLDPELPSPGAGFYYLRTAIDGLGDERGAGATSAGLPRDLPGCF